MTTEKNVEPEIPIGAWIFIFFGTIFTLRAVQMFDTTIWISDTGFDGYGTFNIEQPLFYMITGSALILSGTLLLGINNIREGDIMYGTQNLQWIFIILGILFITRGIYSFNTYTYVLSRGGDSTEALNIERPMFYGITGSGFILSGSLLNGLNSLTHHLKIRDDHSQDKK